ncbi:HAD family hydrolase [Schleiferilactobacillus shenzhenensis]|uniref:Gph n=1 Tax=Schleiferilactobacillus shenzhenensis LY-73 TaxID=1231336 RepID=U4TXB7_9LACO|nr:HAD family phosphatase [Schleiferilactobacillus shenzhenensis]ERL66458.1 Gph [Schleiferilactobacillus shenzhenensis LY-73]
MKFDGVIFDMDGVLVDSERMYLRANLAAGQAQGLTLTAADYAPLAGAANADAKIFFQKYFPGEKAQEFLDDTYALVDQYVAAGDLKIKPGVKTLLTTLHQKGIPLAVGSSNYGRTVNEFLTAVGIKDAFDHIITSDDVAAGKPAPDIFLAAAHALHIAPARALVVEDSANGVQAALNARMTPVLVPDLRSAEEILTPIPQPVLVAPRITHIAHLFD